MGKYVIPKYKRFPVKIFMSDRENYLTSNHEWAVTNLIFLQFMFEHHFEINIEWNGNNFSSWLVFTQLVFDSCDYKIGCNFYVDVDGSNI